MIFGLFNLLRLFEDKTSNENLLIASEKEIIDLDIQDFEYTLSELFKTNSDNILIKRLDELI